MLLPPLHSSCTACEISLSETESDSLRIVDVSRARLLESSSVRIADHPQRAASFRLKPVLSRMNRVSKRPFPLSIQRGEIAVPKATSEEFLRLQRIF
jgi:hypothetical protein